MAYTPATLHLMQNYGGPVGMKEWLYDTVDALATIYAINYISDAKDRRMEKGDRVLVRRWTTAVPATNAEKLTAAATANVLVSMTIHIVLGINATTGAADLTDGLAITATNT